MNEYGKTFEVKWADMDPNRHMRHSVYLDYAAQSRVAIFSDYGLPLDEVAKTGLGPILFREEVKYLKEVHMMNTIRVYCSLKWMQRDGSKWSFFHQIVKDENIPAAEVTVDGAWLNLEARKLEAPSYVIMKTMKKYPRTEGFEWTS